MIYGELRAIAGAIFRGHDAGHTLQPTALVHEAYLRLAETESREWESRHHFLAVASKAMRQILIDHHRKKNAQKRGGGDGWERITLSGLEIGASTPEVELLSLDEALRKLEALDPRQAQVVELRYFGGLTVDETAAVIGVSRTTVEGEWRHARAWLTRELADDR